MGLADRAPAVMQHECWDCLADPEHATKRPRKLATGPGEPKRCATHLRAFKAAQRRTRRASHVERTYDISAKDAGELLVYQGGRCWICGKADGTTKALAVDHDHATDWPRGRLCGPDNIVVGRIRDDPRKAERLLRYLVGDTPYRRMLAERAFGAKVAYLDVLPEGRVAVILLDGSEQWSTLDELQAYATPKGER